MKKIMFNDKYGLTQAVLEGRKTQTRRIIEMPDYDEEYLDTAFDWDFRESVIIDRYAKYKAGEIVAVAQSYSDIDPIIREGKNKVHLEYMDSLLPEIKKLTGWNNKMFVKAKYMPHQILITNVRVERLQDISDEDCLAEGIIKKWHAPACRNYFYLSNLEIKSTKDVYNTPQEAYEILIDKVGNRGDWNSNPYVFVYDFKLIK